MSIDRRQLIGWFAASAATALSGCGGGDYHPLPTRFVWLLNLNQEFSSVDVSFGATTVSTALPCPGLTPHFQVEYGVYTVSLRDRISGIVENSAERWAGGAAAQTVVLLDPRRLLDGQVTWLGAVEDA